MRKTRVVVTMMVGLAVLAGAVSVAALRNRQNGIGSTPSSAEDSGVQQAPGVSENPGVSL